MAGGQRFSRGDPVWWTYRVTKGWGHIRGVDEDDDDADKVRYSINQVDNHPGEPSVVFHLGADIHHATENEVDAARRRAEERDGKAGEPMLKIKSVPIEVKAGPDDGLADGEFLAYPSTFTRTPDSYGDVVAPGAFAKTIADWKASGDVMPIMYLHDPNQIVGAATDMGEDDHGFWVKGKFDDDPASQKVYRLLKGRRLSSLSFAYDVADEGPVQLDGGVKANELRAVNVHEASLLPKGFAANPDTSVVAVKSLADALTFELKAGRVLAGKHIDSLRGARDAIDSVITAAEATQDDQGKASGKSAAGDQGASGDEPTVPGDGHKTSPSVDSILAVISIRQKEVQ